MAKKSHLFPVDLKFGQWLVETALLYMCQRAEINWYGRSIFTVTLAHNWRISA